MIDSKNKEEFTIIEDDSVPEDEIWVWNGNRFYKVINIGEKKDGDKAQD